MSVEPASVDVVLEARGLRKHFGGLHALDGVDLRVRRGSLVGVIGPNGAGKTTLFNVLAGSVQATAGSVHLLGRDVSRLPVHHRARAGLARTFQITRALGRLTVLENLLVAGTDHPGERWWAPFVTPRGVETAEANLVTEARALLDFVQLGSLRDHYAGSLSGGQKKLLELARVLMMKPSVVLLDEPVAGVNPTLARHLLERIEKLRADHGLTFVLVEHDLETVFAHCDPIVVMAEGRVLATGNAKEIRSNPDVLDAYLGG